MIDKPTLADLVLAPGDDKIVGAMWDAYSAVRDKDPHASCLPAMAAALAVARPMILRQVAQAAPAQTMRSAEEVWAVIEKIIEALERVEAVVELAAEMNQRDHEYHNGRTDGDRPDDPKPPAYDPVETKAERNFNEAG